MAPPSWKLPEGVDGPLWEYAHAARLATTEDAYFANHPLFAADAAALDERFTEPGPLVDLGCGAGRLSLHFARKQFPVVAIDLSRPMLETVGVKARGEGLSVGRVEANLCRLTCLPDASFAYALAMFSTFGMIRGPSARREAMAEAARVLQPGGRLALHAHNLWLNLGDPAGRRWLLSRVGPILRGLDVAGDRQMTYRGIPGMVVHLYRWPELRRDIHAAGLVIDEVIPIDTVTAQTIPVPRFWPGLRAGGWIVFASRPGD